MRNVWKLLLVTIGVGLAATAAIAQAPEESREGAPKTARNAGADKAPAVDAMVSRMMAFDKNKDDKLTRDEMTGSRMERMFDRADANHDGVVTKEELVAWATKLVADDARNRDVRGGMGPSDGGPGAPDRRRGPGGRGFGGRGFGGFGARSQPGQIMSPSIVETLKLTAQQKKAGAELQKHVDEQLGTILTAKQKQRLKDLQQASGPGGFGPGRRDRGGPGGPPSQNAARDRVPGTRVVRRTEAVLPRVIVVVPLVLPDSVLEVPADSAAERRLAKSCRPRWSTN